MALWSNTDAVPGLATARYTVGTTTAFNGTITITGTGSSFGLAGCAQTGDVIRFGADARGSVAAGHTFFGDAVITSIASTESLTIGSTVGLESIGFTTSARFSRLPKSSVLDFAFSDKLDSGSSEFTIATASALSAAPAGFGLKVIHVRTDSKNGITAGESPVTTIDTLVNNGVNVGISSIGVGIVTALTTVGAGESIVRVAVPPGLAVNNHLENNGTSGSTRAIAAIGSTSTVTTGTVSHTATGQNKTIPIVTAPLNIIASSDGAGVADIVSLPDNTNRRVVSVSSTSIVLNTALSASLASGVAVTITQASAATGVVNLTRGIVGSIAVNDSLIFKYNAITLDSDIAANIAEDDTLTFQRFVGGYDRTVYGISTATGGAGIGSANDLYHVGHQGWVGVTTYIDMHGTLRIKSEVLVAMSGIDTTTDVINSTPSVPYRTDRGLS